jgi:hypothetical protein
LPKRKGTQTSKGNVRKKRSDSVPEVSVEFDEDGMIICPEEDECFERFHTIEDMVQHLVDQTLKRGYRQSWFVPNTLEAAEKGSVRKCVCCPHTWPEKLDNRRATLIPHIDRHFPREIACNGACGKETCKYFGGTEKNLKDHIADQKKEGKYQCGACGQRFKRQAQLDQHVQTNHVRKQQVVGFALKAGFDVGDLAKTSPWMTDEDLSLPNEPVLQGHPALKIAEDAVRALVSAQKAEKEAPAPMTWFGLEGRSGGNGGVNPASICDECR